MLDIETKRRIDNARDILVGKIPDPKSQVEQITLALTYKFMDDMDKQSEDWGGEASFFTGEFSRYSWSSIFDPKLGGYELLNLYSEALLKMNQNPNIPVLFREIFKNAYLPYRDPETLKSFLKEINGFCYDHSERLGDAYEYLLSVLGSQGDAGQFRTPRHIIDFIVRVLDPKKNETILDPACGTAGFLISSFKHIMEENTKDTYGDQLTPEERNRLITNFTGYDISPDMVRISLVNMYLHGFADPKIHEYDTLTSEERWKDTADVILANPPFMTPTGGIRPHKRFSIQANRSEVLFVDYIAEHLNNNGRAGIIVPEGIIFQSGNAYKALRKILVENYLYAVVSLPAGVFNPYAGVKTSILFLDKSLAKKADSILFVKVSNDGFDLGAQRKEIAKNDIPEAYEILTAYKTAITTGKEDNHENSKISITVSKEKVAENGEYNLNAERYKIQPVRSLSNYEIVELGTIAEIISGQSPESKYYNSVGNGLPFYQGKTEFTDMYIGEPKVWTEFVTKLAEKGDILMSVRAPVGPVNFATQQICIGRGLASIRANSKVLPIYLFFMLRSMQNNITGNGGAVFDSISRKQIEEIKIPLPPIEIQKEIVAEIKSYQNIIDGAKQVVENYKPQIKIDPEWELVDLEFITNITTGKLNANEAKPDGQYPFFTCSKDTYKIDKFAFDCEALLLAGNNAVGVFDVKYYKGKFNAYQRTYVITINNEYKEKISYSFLYYQLNEKLNLLKDNSIGSSTRYLTIGMINSLKIPVPPFDIQQQLVKQLEEEQELIKSNNRLIAVFERKITQIVTTIWGNN